MNYISSLKDIPNIKKIRNIQLEKQKQVDNELEKINTECPTIVAEYLLSQRFLSRKQQHEMIDANIIDFIPTLHKHFTENDKIYEDFFAILNSNNKCQCLQKLIVK